MSDIEILAAIIASVTLILPLALPYCRQVSLELQLININHLHKVNRVVIVTLCCRLLLSQSDGAAIFNLVKLFLSG